MTSAAVECSGGSASNPSEIRTSGRTFLEAANYSSSGTLCNGERVLIRSFKPEDREEFFIAAGRSHR